ncbi:hypothetical protein Tco_1410410 [Tanacetum coccineum]
MLRRRGESPYVPDPFAPRGAVLRYPCEGKMKRTFEKESQRVLENVGREANGAAMRPVRMWKRRDAVRVDRGWQPRRHGVLRPCALPGTGARHPIRPVLKHGTKESDMCASQRCEHACRDPKDGELCLSGAKPEETLVEARSDTDVQIVRLTWEGAAVPLQNLGREPGRAADGADLGDSRFARASKGNRVKFLKPGTWRLTATLGSPETSAGASGRVIFLFNKHTTCPPGNDSVGGRVQAAGRAPHVARLYRCRTQAALKIRRTECLTTARSTLITHHVFQGEQPSWSMEQWLAKVSRQNVRNLGKRIGSEGLGTGVPVSNRRLSADYCSSCSQAARAGPPRAGRGTDLERPFGGLPRADNLLVAAKAFIATLLIFDPSIRSPIIVKQNSRKSVLEFHRSTNRERELGLDRRETS